MTATPAPPVLTVENRSKAILMRVFAGLSGSALVAVIKAASIAGVSPGETLFYRNALALPVVILWISLGPGLRSVVTRRPRAHLVRAVLGLGSMALMFMTIGLLPIAEFTAFLFVVPLFATILSAVFLDEKVGLHRWSAIAVGFTGVLVMTHTATSGGGSTIGIVAALATAVLVSVVTITLRQIGSTEAATTTVFWFTLIGTIATAFTLPFFFQPHDPMTWLLIFGIGLAGALLQIAQTMSLQLAPVSVTAPFDYLQLIWSTLLGWLIWSALPAPATMAGALLIGGAGLYTLYREHYRQRDIAASSTGVN